ncbi:MAG TPA: RNA polymerase sigma factor [Anaerolineales bacterium]|nr:RNA polymerase sigma factor [Anaerolineales bacterium]
MSTPPAHDEGKIISLAQSGDKNAFSILYDSYYKKVYNRVSYMIPTEDVEDVTQEVFIAMVKSLKSFRGESKFSTWLRVITNRQIANYYRKHKRILKESDIEEQSNRLTAKTKLAASSLDHIYLVRGMKELPDHYQEVILLRFADGMKFKQIAKQIDKSLDATKSLYRRAIEALRINLEEDHDRH